MNNEYFGLDRDKLDPADRELLDRWLAKGGGCLIREFLDASAGFRSRSRANGRSDEDIREHLLGAAHDHVDAMLADSIRYPDPINRGEFLKVVRIVLDQVFDVAKPRDTNRETS
ncbi:MAG: hypothetical protein ACYC1I_11660 [Acidimicrobiales bacterium]